MILPRVFQPLAVATSSASCSYVCSVLSTSLTAAARDTASPKIKTKILNMIDFRKLH